MCRNCIVPTLVLLTLTSALASCSSCSPTSEGEGEAGEGEGAEGEGDAAEGEGDAAEGEGDAAEGEGDAAEGEGDAAEGEGDAGPIEICNNLFDEDGDRRFDCRDADCELTEECNPGDGVTGAACTTNKDCFADERDPACLDENNFAFPGGYCSEWCRLNDPVCSGDGVCFSVGPIDFGLCFDRCNDDSECRSGYECSPTLAVCLPTSSCGNGIVEYPETCDGQNLRRFTCETLGFAGGALGCTDLEPSNPCQFDTSACVDVCGDGVIGPTESCEGTPADVACEDFCLASGAVGCDPVTCQLDTSQCIEPVCGNDVVEGCELCDGADLHGATCADAGFVQGTLACADDCEDYDTSNCRDVCGDGIIGSTEECDDRNLDDNDACDSSCRVTACLNRVQLVVGQDSGDTTSGSAFLGSTGCQLDFGGGVPFAFPVDEPGVLTVTLHSATEQSLMIRTDCGRTTSELQCAAPFSGGGEPSITQTFVEAAPGLTVIVMPTASGDAGPFTLDVSFVVPVCGDGVAAVPLEVCDGADLGGETCEFLGFGGGELACTAGCGYDVHACTSSGACDHDVCTADQGALDPAVCDNTCVDAVCGADPSCCTFDWGSGCVDAVSTLCTGQSC